MSEVKSRKTAVKETVAKEEKSLDLLDVLLDKDNKEPIVLMDEKGRQIAFEQVAIIPYDIKEERFLYCVLKPIDQVDGVAEDEAIVFVVDQDKTGNTILRVEEDEERAIAVFDKYYDLLEEARGAAKKTTAKKTTSAAAKKTTTATKKPAAKTTATKTAAKKPAAKTTTAKKSATTVAGKKA